MEMKGNADTSATWAFHDATKYVAVDRPYPDDVVMGTPPDTEDMIWEKDLSIEPWPYKVYESLPPVELPDELTAAPVPALDAIARTGAEPSDPALPAPTRAMLARIGRLCNGLLHRTQARRNGRPVEFRTAGCTGGRYHLEVYFVCADLPDLEAGVYQYSTPDHSLRQIRRGDVRGAVVDACAQEPATRAAPVVMAVTSTFWRNAWRYKARAYRHTFWDAGTLLGQALAAVAAERLPFQLVLGYEDEAINRVLDVDGAREATVALCAIGAGAPPPPPAPDLPRLDWPTRPISAREVDFPMIGLLHRASALRSPEDVAAWRQPPLRRTPPQPRGPLTRLDPVEVASPTIDDLVLRRRSTRNYDTETPISFQAFSSLLTLASHGVATDCTSLDAPTLHDLYLIVNAVEGLAPGVYLHHPRLRSVELLREGAFRAAAQRLAVDQRYAADAHVNCYYLTDLSPVLERYGNRGYRLAQLECSLHAARLHLATHAFGLGAVGSTSLDDEVTDFFSPHAAGKTWMFVTVFGKRRRPR